MQNLKISVIVPIYNKASFLEKSVNSILKQTEKNIEIILVDDGSTDDSSKICEEFAKKDSRILYRRKENGGLTSARNYGRRFAKGDYIGFVDPDDFIETDVYEQMLMCSNGADIVLSGLIHEFAKKKMRQTMPQNLNSFYKNADIRKFILPLFLVYGKGLEKNIQSAQFGRILFKRTFLEEQNILSDEKITYSEDWLFLLEALLKAQNVAIEHNAYYHYVHNSQGLTENYSPRVTTDYIEILKKLDNMGVFSHIPEPYSTNPNLILNFFLQAVKNLALKKDSVFNLSKELKKLFEMDYFKNLGKTINPCNVHTKKRIVIYLVKFKCALSLIILYKCIIAYRKEQNNEI